MANTVWTIEDERLFCRICESVFERYDRKVGLKKCIGEVIELFNQKADVGRTPQALINRYGYLKRCGLYDTYIKQDSEGAGPAVDDPELDLVVETQDVDEAQFMRNELIARIAQRLEDASFDIMLDIYERVSAIEIK